MSAADGNKYYTLPTSNQSNWILFSMGDITRLEYNLQNFRKGQKEGDLTCSATLIWSGTEGNNIPVSLFGDSAIGFVLDPNEIDVPYADFFAYRSGSLIPQEIKKSEASSYDEFSGSHPYKTKYPDKKGKYGNGMGMSIFVTNHAKWERKGPGEAHIGVYNSTGSVSVFAANVWRRYFKRDKNAKGPMRLNEALAVQKGDRNPINGIILYLNKTIDAKDLKKVAEIFSKNPQLNLYLYDTNSPAHIVRWVDNQQAIQALKAIHGDTQKALNHLFQTATPFQGFKLKPQLPEIPPVRLEQTIREIIQKEILPHFSTLDFETQKQALVFSWGGANVFVYDTASVQMKADSVFYTSDTKTGKYDSLKYQFTGSDIRKKQLFNDIAREEMITLMEETQDPRAVIFCQQYKAKLDELQLDKFLTQDEYRAAKTAMQTHIEEWSQSKPAPINPIPAPDIPVPIPTPVKPPLKKPEAPKADLTPKLLAAFKEYLQKRSKLWAWILKIITFGLHSRINVIHKVENAVTALEKDKNPMTDPISIQRTLITYHLDSAHKNPGKLEQILEKHNVSGKPKFTQQ